jgi:Uma2 family endonuclease
MATVAQTKMLTAEEFMAADLGDGTFELVRGEIIEVPPPMPEHGRVVVNSGFALETYGRQSGFGYCLSASAVLTQRGPDTVRGPDICFYSHARWPRSGAGRGLPPVPPDLAVEVVSPGDRLGKIMKRAAEYQGVGIPLIWVVYPASRIVVIHRSDDQPPFVLHEDAVVENLPELPGFRCPVADFLI